MSKKYLWWIENNKGAGNEEFNSEKEALHAIEEGIKQGYYGKDQEWRPVKLEAEACPTCGRPAPRVIINGLGECLRCDHVRGDL